jgi:DNA-binding MarR family transcriptional regulator
VLTTTPGPSAPELASRLRLAITRTARRLRQDAGPGLSPTQAAALSTIDRVGPLTPSELARIEQVQRPTISRVTARLGQAGLIERMPDELDGRGARLRVSPEGRRTLRELRSRKTAYLAERLERLDPEEQAILAQASELLERMLEDEGK